MQIFCYLLSKLLGRGGLRARTALPPAEFCKSRKSRQSQPSKTASKFVLNFDFEKLSIWGSSWGHFGEPLGVIFRHFSLPDRSWRPLGVENVDFLKIVRFPIENLVFSPADGSQNDPRSTRTAPKRQLFRSRISTSFSDRFWLRFASPNASLWAPFSRPKSVKKSLGNRTAPKVAPRTPQDRPRPPQDLPKAAPRPPSR